MVNNLTVIGLGYVGVPTAIAFALNGWNVTGVDIDQKVVDEINHKRLPFIENGLEVALKEAVENGNLSASTELSESSVFIIAVPTPLDSEKRADLSYIENAVNSLIPFLQPGNLVILESTSPPGTTDEIASRILSARNDLSLNAKGDGTVYIAHAPERVLPGRVLVELAALDRIVGGVTLESGEVARDVYKSFCTGQISITDAKTAEMSKLAENSFRDINIAFANELSIICERAGVDVWELRRLANRHPRVEILKPGPGVGGHCVAVDPWFLINTSPPFGALARTAREINDAKPSLVVEKIQEVIRSNEIELKRITILGLTFKPNIDDMRESPALKIAHEIAVKNPSAKIGIMEPRVSEVPDTLIQLNNVSRVNMSNEVIEESDLVVLLVGHSDFDDLRPSLTSARLLLDYCGLMQ